MTRRRRAAALLAAAALTALLAACTTTPAPAPAAPAVDDPAITAIKAAIATVNATAGGPVAAQRAVLDRLAAPDAAAEQRACPTATTTLAFDPAYRGVTIDDGAYLVPTYITIYTGDRITGSDLASLHFTVTDDTARTPTLCVS